MLGGPDFWPLLLTLLMSTLVTHLVELCPCVHPIAPELQVRCHWTTRTVDGRAWFRDGAHWTTRQVDMAETGHSQTVQITFAVTGGVRGAETGRQTYFLTPAFTKSATHEQVLGWELRGSWTATTASPTAELVDNDNGSGSVSWRMSAGGTGSQSQSATAINPNLLGDPPLIQDSGANAGFFGYLSRWESTWTGGHGGVVVTPLASSRTDFGAGYTYAAQVIDSDAQDNSASSRWEWEVDWSASLEVTFSEARTAADLLALVELDPGGAAELEDGAIGSFVLAELAADMGTATPGLTSIAARSRAFDFRLEVVAAASWDGEGELEFTEELREVTMPGNLLTNPTSLVAGDIISTATDSMPVSFTLDELLEPLVDGQPRRARWISSPLMVPFPAPGHRRTWAGFHLAAT